MERAGQQKQDHPASMRKKREQINGNQARYYRLLNAIHEVYYSADVNGNITYRNQPVNPHRCRL